jgi:hypothetical protein
MWHWCQCSLQDKCPIGMCYLKYSLDPSYHECFNCLWYTHLKKKNWCHWLRIKSRSTRFWVQIFFVTIKWLSEMKRFRETIWGEELGCMDVFLCSLTWLPHDLESRFPKGACVHFPGENIHQVVQLCLTPLTKLLKGEK